MKLFCIGPTSHLGQFRDKRKPQMNCGNLSLMTVGESARTGHPVPYLSDAREKNDHSPERGHPSRRAQKRSRLSRLGQTERASVGTNANSAGGPVCASLTLLRERTSRGLALSVTTLLPEWCLADAVRFSRLHVQDSEEDPSPRVLRWRDGDKACGSWFD